MSSLFFKRRLSGRDYRIKVFRFAKRCQVTMQDIITSATWKGSFDHACIETMTRKTGRFVPFEMFLSLLLASLRNGVCDSQLGVMTFRDLQNLFREEVRPSIAKQMDDENRRYLILTVNQPMITHYPLPLLYTQWPDPELMSMTKLELQNNMAATTGGYPSTSPQSCPPQQTSPAMKRVARKKERVPELERPRSRKISFGKGDFLERVMGEQIERALNDSFGHGAAGETVESLRLELREQARDFKRELTRLRRENERLRRHVEEMKIREMELTSELVRMTERERLNLPPSVERTRCRSSSTGTGRHRRRRTHGSESTGSLASQTPRVARSLFNFFDTEEAWSGRRASLDRRRSSPAVRGESAERSRRLHAQMRSKSLEDTRACAAAERLLCSPGRRCYRRSESTERRRRWEEPERARPVARWTAFDPSQYVTERRKALRQRSLEREMAARRTRGVSPPAPAPAPVPAPRAQSRPRPSRKRVARSAATVPADQSPSPPPPERWEDVGDSAVVGMRQLETRLKNLQRMLSEKLT